MHVALQPHPHRIERPFAHAPVVVHLAHDELRRRDRDLLIGVRRAVVEPECPPDQQHVEPEEAEHRPGPGKEENHSGHEARAAQHRHEDQKSDGAQRPVRRKHGRRYLGYTVGVVVGCHGRQYRKCMASKKPRNAAPRRVDKKALAKAREGKAAKVKGARKRAAADSKAAAGALPQWKPAEIEEAFRRLKAAMPDPETELEHEDPYQLLVAVVLSAQATDAGVNKATPALFAAAPTPEKMVKLGEAKVREFIKTIGLFRMKAKNVVALSQKLIDEHGGKVPPSREALEQ